ncbi:MAG: MBL fold metallo-hydrolase [Bacteroidetes bacterium]|nr:MBL fold metallo-hydrolase [Bacteroidota bacterium]MCL5025801.1 MBL fold metallo-hydrolase [Chloroflexota bacterium]
MLAALFSLWLLAACAPSQPADPPSDVPMPEATPTAAGPREPLTVTFVDVGQGDAAWLRTPDGYNIVIDGGPVQAGSSLLQYLQDNGVSSVDLMVLTHPHDDHSGGLDTILRNVPVKEVLENGQRNPGPADDVFVSLRESNDITDTIGRAGQTLNWGCCVSATLLHPADISDPDINGNSLVLKVSYGAMDFLFTGDIGKAAEESLVASLAGSDPPVMPAEVLKVAHHGSNGSSESGFLEAVQPRVAVISVGAHNRYRHPGAAALTRLSATGADIYRTDQSGSIAVTTDGATYTLAFPDAPATPTTTPAPANP